MEKSAILFGSALGFALMFGQGAYASDDNINNTEINTEISQTYEKEHKKCKKHNCKDVKKKLEQIIKKSDKNEPLFEKEPAKYFKNAAINSMFLVKAYKECEDIKNCKNCCPSDEHVEAVKLHYIMFEAWANACKGEDETNKDLLAKAHDKVPEIIKSAQHLLETCCKKADKKSSKKEEDQSKPEENGE